VRQNSLPLFPPLSFSDDGRATWCARHQVEIILGDATDPKLEGLPPSGSCDVVSISYAVTMIPNWKDVLQNAYRLLKPGGHICVCDFTLDAVSRSPPPPSPPSVLLLSSLTPLLPSQLFPHARARLGPPGDRRVSGLPARNSGSTSSARITSTSTRSTSRPCRLCSKRSTWKSVTARSLTFHVFSSAHTMHSSG